MGVGGAAGVKTMMSGSASTTRGSTVVPAGLMFAGT
jgi:hypothetical protein